jgi:hypothetical protein
VSFRVSGSRDGAVSGGLECSPESSDTPTSGEQPDHFAKPGEVIVSRTVVDLVVRSGIQFSDRGEHDCTVGLITQPGAALRSN